MNHADSYLKRAIKTNPITLMGLVCLMLCSVVVQSDPLIIRPEFFFGSALVVALWARHWVPTEKQHVVFLVSFFLGSGAYSVVDRTTYPAVSLLFIGFGLLAALLVYWFATKQMTVKRGVLLCMAAGFLLRLCYVLYTPVWVRQHDVFYFSYGDFTGFTYQRHAEYIEYIATHLTLPQVDPTTVGLSQLYHPPFHHFIAGLWLRLQWLIGIDRGVSYENIQFLTLFYSAACMVIGYRILHLLNGKRWGLLLPMAVLCFHPTFIIMAGSINNDLLSVTLAFYGVYAALRWYRKPTFYHIITVALGVGLSMMTKLSGGLIAPGIAILFLCKWIAVLRNNKREGVDLFAQFAVFGIICIPLALWWQVKNAMVYGIPLTYVPALDQNSGQYLGDYTPWQRLFGLPKESLNRIFMAWNNEVYGSSYNEYSMFLSMLKTSVFGEFTLFTPHLLPNAAAHMQGERFSQILFWSNIVLVGLSLYAGIRTVIRKRTSPVSWSLLTVFAAVMGSYVQFCFAYPQACTQNFRYAVPALLCGLVALGNHLENSSRPFKIITAATALVFCFSSFGVYWLLGTV